MATIQGVKPLYSNATMAKYSREQINAAIDAAMQVFGLKSLKYQQWEAIRRFVSGQDVFVSLPTGFGKSYCSIFYLLCLTVYILTKNRP